MGYNRIRSIIFLAGLLGFVFCQPLFANGLCRAILKSLAFQQANSSKERVEAVLDMIDAYGDVIADFRKDEIAASPREEFGLSELALPRSLARRAHLGFSATSVWAFTPVQSPEFNLWNRLTSFERFLLMSSLSARLRQGRYSFEFRKTTEKESVSKLIGLTEIVKNTLWDKILGILASPVFIPPMLVASGSMLYLSSKFNIKDKLKYVSDDMNIVPTGISPLLYYRRACEGGDVGVCTDTSDALVFLARELGASHWDVHAKTGIGRRGHEWVAVRPWKGIPFEWEVEPTGNKYNIELASFLPVLAHQIRFPIGSLGPLIYATIPVSEFWERAILAQEKKEKAEAK